MLGNKHAYSPKYLEVFLSISKSLGKISGFVYYNFYSSSGSVWEFYTGLISKRHYRGVKGSSNVKVFSSFSSYSVAFSKNLTISSNKGADLYS